MAASIKNGHQNEKKPFNIFPRIGYRNSQSQILSNIDNLKIELFHQGKLVKTVFSSSENIVIIHKFDQPGIYIAKCTYQGKNYKQEIEIRDAFRLGSSEFKKAFVFDNSDYSFFLMKDRLLLYDETKDILLTPVSSSFVTRMEEQQYNYQNTIVHGNLK